MSKLSRFVSYGIEDGEVVDGVVDPIEEAKPDDQVEVETELAQKNADEVEGDVEELSDVAESLEAICIGIRSTLRFGGMNRQAAAFALQSADMQLARLGLEGIAVSVEDFAEPDELVDAENKTSVEPDAASVVGSDEAGIAEDDNVDAEAGEVVTSEDPEIAENLAVTQEAEKTIGERLRAVWEAIKNAIVAFFKKIGEYLATAWNFIKRQVGKAKDLIVKLGSLPAAGFRKLKVKSRLKDNFGRNELTNANKNLKDIAKKNNEKLKEFKDKLEKVYKKILSKDDAEVQDGVAEYKAIADEMDAFTKQEVKVEAAGEVTVIADAPSASNEETYEGEATVVIESKEELAGLAKEAEQVSSDDSLKKAQKDGEGLWNAIKAGADRFFKAVTSGAKSFGSGTVDVIKKIGSMVLKAGKFVLNVIRKAVGWVMKMVGKALSLVAAAIVAVGAGAGLLVGGAAAGAHIAGDKIAGE